MYFIDRALRTPGLMIVLPVLGAVLVFVQLGLAIQVVLRVLQDLGMARI